MSLVNDGSGNMVMPVGPMNGNGSLGWGGDGSFWIIILFLFAFMNGNWGGWGNNAGGAMPYIMNNTTNNDMQRGFDQQAIMGGLNGINTALAMNHMSYSERRGRSATTGRYISRHAGSDNDNMVIDDIIAKLENMKNY